MYFALGCRRFALAQAVTALAAAPTAQGLIWARRATDRSRRTREQKGRAARAAKLPTVGLCWESYKRAALGTAEVSYPSRLNSALISKGLLVLSH